MKDHILLFNNYGWATFPCNITKEPACKNWKPRRPDPLNCLAEMPEYEKAGAYGVVLRPEDLILDIDPRNFGPAGNPWRNLKNDLGIPDFKAPGVLTGGGGAHVYLRKPPELKLLATLPGYPGMDIKSGNPGKGAYVIGPGSKHASGKLYRLAAGLGLESVPDAPEGLLEVLARRETPKNTLPDTFHGGEQERKRYGTWLDQQPGAVEGEAGDLATFKAIAKGRDFGLRPEDTLVIITNRYNPRCQPSWSAEELATKVRNVYKYASGTAGWEDPVHVFNAAASPAWDTEEDAARRWDVDGNGNIKRTLKNAITYLYIKPEMKNTIRLNRFTGDIEMTGKVPWFDNRAPGGTWTDTDLVLLKYHLAKTASIEFSTAMMWDALHAVAVRYAYHPIRDFVEGLEWDGAPRLDTWLPKYCDTPDNIYTHAVGRKLIVGMIARIFEPGKKFDCCLVLEGAQGIGKSTICSILGGEWFGDIVLDPHARDTIDAMRGKWVVELSEMEVTKRADAQALRAFISRTTDRARLAYARSAQDFPRQCVFVGTVNPDGMGYLSDEQNRRFWPVKCGAHIKTGEFAEVRDQLLAEAYTAYKTGEELFLSGSLADFAEIEQAKRRNIDPWEDVIADYLQTTGLEVREISVHQVWELVFGGQAKNMGRAEQCRIGRAMRAIGWFKTRPTRGGGRAYMFERPGEIITS